MQAFHTNRHNQVKFLEDFALKFGIRKPSDWCRVTKKQVKESGGNTYLLEHGGSLPSLLRNAFPSTDFQKSQLITGINWQEALQPLNYQLFISKESQASFLRNLQTKLLIKSPSDWGKITYKQFRDCGGNPLIMQYGSILKMLKSVFPGSSNQIHNILEVEWKQEWFRISSRPKTNTWTSLEARQKFLERMALKFNIQKPSDWGKIQYNHIRGYGGSGLIRKYNNSVYQMLVDVFPGIKYFIYLNHARNEMG